MADEIKKIKIKELPLTTSIGDNDVFVESDTLETYKVTAHDLAGYISGNGHMTERYLTKDSLGAVDGVAPLNAAGKIDGGFLTYGIAANTAYEGVAGKRLEQNIDSHLTDENAHGYQTKINGLQETLNANIPVWNDKYTKNEIDSLFLENAVPKATQNNDGLLTKEDKIIYDDTAAKKHVHSNQIVLDRLTQGLIEQWNAAKAHADSAHAPANAEANQNAFSSIAVGSSTIAADSKTDTLTLAAGSNITLTPDPAGDKITITAKDTVYTHPSSDGNKHVPQNGTSNGGKYLKATASAGAYEWGSLLKSDVTAALGYTPGTSSTDTNTTYTLSKSGSTITLTGSDGSRTSVTDSDTNTTYSVATTGANGLMSAADKTKLDGITSDADTVSFSRNLTSGTKVGTITINGSGTDLYAPSNTDTKNTAGSTNSTSKLYLIGALSQASYPQTYSRSSAYIGTDGCLYSNGARVVSEFTGTTEPTNQKTGDYWLLDY